MNETEYHNVDKNGAYVLTLLSTLNATVQCFTPHLKYGDDI